MKDVLKKIAQARINIKELNLKKAGRNSYSEYDYYTPEQISLLVNQVSNDLNILNTYELKRTEFGLVAQLTVWDLDGDDFHTFSIATDIPVIKATNVAQQLGGAVTYSERYLLMSTYDIKDNNLDFDANKKPEKKQETKTNPIYIFGVSDKLEWVKDGQVSSMIKQITNDKSKVLAALPKYRWSNANKEKIIKALDDAKN